MKDRLFVGTSGWSYAHWKGIFYPKGLKSSEMLLYYAEHFSSVEINSSFYRLPLISTVKGWATKTEDNFRFCAKMSRYITHIKRLHYVDEPLEQFFNCFKPLKKKLGPILVQFPPNLSFDRNRIDPFFKLLAKHTSFSFAIEGRHSSWIEDEAIEYLKDWGMAWVIADSGRRYPFLEKATGEIVYFRFHGPQGTYEANYPNKILKHYAECIATYLNEGKEVYAFFNNDIGGYAVENAKTLREMIINI